jgi:hypothetical protein
VCAVVVVVAVVRRSGFDHDEAGNISQERAGAHNDLLAAGQVHGRRRAGHFSRNDFISSKDADAGREFRLDSKLLLGS